MFQLNHKKMLIFLTCLLALGACANRPTSPAQITGSYSSGLVYESFSCRKLAAEQESLARRESRLVIAQEQRIKSSNMQAWWLGYGQGDGMEASELATVRGQKEAVRTALAAKGC